MAAASGLMSYGMAGGRFGKGAKVPDTGINTSMDLAWDPSGNLSNSQMLQHSLNMDASALPGLGMDIGGSNSFGSNQTVLRNPGYYPSLNYSMGLGHNIDMNLFGVNRRRY